MMVFGVRGVSAVEQLTRCSSLYEGMTWCAWNDESSWTLFQDKLESMRRKKISCKGGLIHYEDCVDGKLCRNGQCVLDPCPKDSAGYWGAYPFDCFDSEKLGYQCMDDSEFTVMEKCNVDEECDYDSNFGSDIMVDGLCYKPCYYDNLKLKTYEVVCEKNRLLVCFPDGEMKEKLCGVDSYCGTSGTVVAGITKRNSDYMVGWGWGLWDCRPLNGGCIVDWSYYPNGDTCGENMVCENGICKQDKIWQTTCKSVVLDSLHPECLVSCKKTDDNYIGMDKWGADYNCSGDLTTGDYIVWRDEFFKKGTERKGDGDCDGKTSLSDYSKWREEYLK